LLLTSLDKAMVPVGQLAMQTLQPLHLSVSTTIAPFSAIFFSFFIIVVKYSILSNKS